MVWHIARGGLQRPTSSRKTRTVAASPDVFDSHLAEWDTYLKTPWARVRYDVVATVLDETLAQLGPARCMCWTLAVATDSIPSDSQQRGTTSRSWIRRLECSRGHASPLNNAVVQIRTQTPVWQFGVCRVSPCVLRPLIGRYASWIAPQPSARPPTRGCTLCAGRAYGSRCTCCPSPPPNTTRRTIRPSSR